MQNLFLYIIALTPGIGIAFYIYFTDKYEPEPLKLVILSFLMGIPSFGVNLLLGLPLDSLVSLLDKKAASNSVSIHAFGATAFVEELCKFIVLRGILYRNKNFNEPLDGIIYSVMVAMGFATAENLLYAYTGGGGAVVMRMFSAIPAHAAFAVLMGFMLGKAKFAKNDAILFGVEALAVATLFHGLYDYFLFRTRVPGIWLGSLVCLLVAFYFSKRAVKIDQDESPFRNDNHPVE